MNAGRSEKQRLIWIIDFINLNIDELAMGDFLKLLAEIQGKLKHLNLFILPSRPKNRKELSAQLSNLGPGGILIDRAIEKKPGLEKDLLFYEDTPKMRNLIKSIQSRVRDFLGKIYEAKDKPMDRSLLSFENLFLVMVGDGGIALGPVSSEYNFEYELAQLIFNCSPPSDKAVEGFAELVHSLKILKRCQAPIRGGICSNFFLQVHNKEKNYCSNQCAWRAYSKFVRDEEKKDRAKQKKQRKEG